MVKLPVIVGFGGINAAGRSSGHNGYRRMMEAMSHADSGKLRIGGALCMVIGLVVLYLVNN